MRAASPGRLAPSRGPDGAGFFHVGGALAEVRARTVGLAVDAADPND